MVRLVSRRSTAGTETGKWTGPAESVPAEGTDWVKGRTEREGRVPGMSNSYRHPALRQLKEQQARFAPKERRIEQIDRAEQLLAEIDSKRCYPYEYLCFRITGYRPEATPALVLDGGNIAQRSVAGLRATFAQVARDG